MKRKIPAYNNQDEKRKFFTLEIIDTEDKFRELFDIILPQKFKQGGIWRGLPESSYKLYNSLQRENLKHMQITTFEGVNNAIENSTNELSNWNKGVIRRYFQNNHNIDEIPHYAALSILQHYGCKTPLLDWTNNPNVALYFAVNDEKSQLQSEILNIKSKIINVLCGKKDNIKNYFSIYFITNIHPYYDLTSKTGYYEIIGSDTENEFINNKVNFVIEHGGDKVLQKIERDIAINQIIQNEINRNESIIGNIKNTPIQRVEDSPKEKTTHFLNVNYNINAQHGLFILNADPIYPLEEAINRRIHSAIINRSEDDPIDDWEKRNKENFICYDINKKFKKRILKELRSKKINVTKETIEPDFKKLKDEITFEKITKNIRKNENN